MDWLLGEIKGLMLILFDVMMKLLLCYFYKISLFILDIFTEELTNWKTFIGRRE